MRVYIRDKRRGGGSWLLMQELTRSLREEGVQVVHNRKGQYDIILANSNDIGWQFLTKMKNRGMPIVARLDSFIDNGNCYKGIARVADFLIFQSDFSRYLFETVSSDNTPRTIVYNGADPEIFTAEGEKAINDTKPLLLAVAHKWFDYKRLESILAAHRELQKDVDLCVVGEDVEEYIRLYPNVLWTGPIKDKYKMAKLYRSADILLFLSRIDACSSVVIESILCGTPVICTSDDGSGELVQDCGIILPTNNRYVPGINRIRDLNQPVPAALTCEAVEAILSNPRGYMRPRPDLYMDRCAKRYKGILEEVWERSER